VWLSDDRVVITDKHQDNGKEDEVSAAKKTSQAKGAGWPRGRSPHTQVPLAEELSALLAEREMSMRALGREVEVSQSHLSRVCEPGSGRIASGELARRVALALGLPEDYFPEFRSAAVHEAVDADPLLREQIFRRIRRSDA
jgi:transcriptional regulator with XRE-family HTH domain